MYDGATYFAWAVMAILSLVAVGLIVWLGSLPGKIAKGRNHPQTDAINACSWIGLALLGTGWPIAFVWAFVHAGPVGAVPPESAPANADDESPAEIDELKARLAELELELQTLKDQG